MYICIHICMCVYVCVCVRVCVCVCERVCVCVCVSVARLLLKSISLALNEGIGFIMPLQILLFISICIHEKIHRIYAPLTYP